MNRLRAELRGFCAAVMFFTRLPAPSFARCEAEDLRRAVVYCPLVGWIVGAAAAAAWWLALHWWPPAIASGISLVVTLLLTGALHEDGFADVCDGFGGGYTKERTLEIMHDSRLGAFGVIGLVAMLGLKWQAVAALPVALAPAVLIAAHALSRGASVSLLATLTYAREAGKAQPLAARLRGARLLVALGFALAPLALLPARLWWGVLAVALARAALASWFARRIGGCTGDCLGAAQQVGEVVFYLAALALA